MGDLDSTLKTQMFMSESARQNAMDLSARISAGFQAAGEGIRFEGEMSRSMVQSAAQFKQIQIDEWYKSESLKNEAKALQVRQQELELNNSYRQDQLDARLEQNRLIREDKLAKDEQTKAASLITNKINVLDQENEGLVIEATRIEDQLKQLEEDAKDPIKYPESLVSDLRSQYQSSLAKYQNQIISNKFKTSRLAGVKGEVIAGMVDLPTAYKIAGESYKTANQEADGSLSGLGPNPNLDGLNESNIGEPVNPLFDFNPNQNQTNQSPGFDREAQTNDYLEGNNARVVEPAKKQYTHSRNDLNNYINNPNTSYVPQTAKQLFELMPEPERKQFEKDLTQQRAIDIAKQAHSSVSGNDYKSNINPRYNDVLPFDDYDKKTQVLDKAKELQHKRKGGKLEDVIKEEIPFKFFQEAAAEVFDLNKVVTPEKDSLEELGGSLVTSSKPGEPPPTKNESVGKYFKMFGVDTPEAIMSGTNDSLRSEANAYADFKSHEKNYLESSDTDLLKKLMTVSNDVLGIGKVYHSSQSKAQNNERMEKIKFLMKNKKLAAQAIAEEEVRKTYGAPKQFTRFSMPSI